MTRVVVYGQPTPQGNKTAFRTWLCQRSIIRCPLCRGLRRLR